MIRFARNKQKRKEMDIPFVFGKIADGKDFTDRKEDTERLLTNFRGLVSTVIISPRRWGKTSLVNHVLERLGREKGYMTCKVDVFNCRTEAQFYQAYVNAVLRASATKVDELIGMAKQYLRSFGPKLTFGEMGSQHEMSLGLDFRDRQYSVDEILDLPQRIAEERGKKFVVCIDEFQNVSAYDDPVGFQRQLRAHWQGHDRVGYCLYGSKKHMLLDIFSNYEMPFYKFGDIMFLDKICEAEWEKYIVERFGETGKKIDADTARHVAQLVECHPYYVQQLAQQAWLRTEDACDKKIVDGAFDALVDQLGLLFSNTIDSLRARQISFLQAIADGEVNYSSADVLARYGLGTSANVKNLKAALLDRDLIDADGRRLTIQDPLFAYWLKTRYMSGRG